MSKIYWDSKNKAIFTRLVKYYCNSNYNVRFIKKYHKYELYIDFLPKVIKNIICEYTNDIIWLNYNVRSQSNNIYNRSFDFFGNSTINYEPTYFQFMISFDNVRDMFVVDEIHVDKHKVTDINDTKLLYKKCNDMVIKDLQHNIACIKKIIDCIINIKLCADQIHHTQCMLRGLKIEDYETLIIPKVS